MTASLDTLADAPPLRPDWQECHVAFALRVLPDDAANALRRALARPRREVQHTEIADALWNDHRLIVDRQSIGRHRAGRCKTCRNAG
jgi:hypothetical protein